jgi:hypothetical protein
MWNNIYTKTPYLYLCEWDGYEIRVLNYRPKLLGFYMSGHPYISKRHW